MATTPVSPKVKAGANWAAYATLALTLLSVVTPDSLSFMGHLAPLAYGVVVGGTYALGAFLKSDDLRDTGAAKIAADAIAAAANATSANLPAAPAVTHVYNAAPVADTSLPAVDVTQPASIGAVDGGFQSKIEAAISGATPAVDPAPAATPAPAVVPAQPAQ